MALHGKVELEQHNMYVAGTEARGADELVDVDGARSKRAHDALALVQADVGQGLGWRAFVGGGELDGLGRPSQNRRKRFHDVAGRVPPPA